MKTGKHSVVIGNVDPNSHIGEGSVVVGPTDSHGNTILNTPMAVGYGAQAGPGSISIGAFAGGGLRNVQLPHQLQPEIQELINLAIHQANQPLLAAFEQLAAELREPKPRGSAVLLAWEGVKALATIDGAQNLLARGTTALLAYLAQNGA